MKSLSELLADAIPTPWSKAIAALTLLAVPAAYNFPSILPSTYLPTSQEQVFLIRLLLSSLSALSCVFIVLILVIRAYHKQSKQLAIVEESLKAKSQYGTVPLNQRQDKINYPPNGIV